MAIGYNESLKMNPQELVDYRLKFSKALVEYMDKKNKDQGAADRAYKELEKLNREYGNKVSRLEQLPRR
jgi:hypothetical protein